MNKFVLFALFFSILSNGKSLNNEFSYFGVKISFLATDKIFPQSWLTKEVNGKAIPLDSGEFERSKKIIIKALNKYPEEVIKKHLTKVFIVKSLEFYGQNYGGTNSDSVVYLTNKGVDQGYSDFWIEQTFHSEFSSILLRDYSFLFDEKKWVSINNDVHYGQSGVNALKEGKASITFDLELNKKGILAQYGMASVEEDFNLFAGNIFLSSPGFWKIERSQTRIEKKTNQIIQFYNIIDPRFNKEYFVKISQK